jgi:hypothetical protein
MESPDCINGNEPTLTAASTALSGTDDQKQVLDAARSLSFLVSRSQKMFRVYFGKTSIVIDPSEAFAIAAEYGPEIDLPWKFPPAMTYGSQEEEAVVIFRSWNPNFLDHFYFDEKLMRWQPKSVHGTNAQRILSARRSWKKGRKKAASRNNKKMHSRARR